MAKGTTDVPDTGQWNKRHTQALAKGTEGLAHTGQRNKRHTRQWTQEQKAYLTQAKGTKRNKKLTRHWPKEQKAYPTLSCRTSSLHHHVGSQPGSAHASDPQYGT